MTKLNLESGMKIDDIAREMQDKRRKGPASGSGARILGNGRR